MIGHDSVVALNNGFVCADKLRVGANAFTNNGVSKVTRIATAHLSSQIHIMTEHFSVILSPDQFLVCDSDEMDEMIMAGDVTVGEEVLCSTGPEIVVGVGVTFLEGYPMIEIATQNGFLVSNGFHLFSGQWQ